MDLSSNRLRLRPWRLEDSSAFAAMNAEREMSRHLSPLTREKSCAMLERILAHLAQHGWGYWALEVPQDGELIGLCGLMHVPFEAFFTPAVEISWRLSAKWQGQGGGTDRTEFRFRVPQAGPRRCIHCDGQCAILGPDGKAGHEADRRVRQFRISRRAPVASQCGL